MRFGQTKYLHNLDPLSARTDGTYWNDVGFGTDQTFDAKITTDLIISYKFCSGSTFTIGANNLFDVYPDRVFIDERNDPQAVYTNPNISSTNKTTGGYAAGRDNSNRGRFLFNPNQFGYNGRFLFARLAIELSQLKNCKIGARPRP